MLASDQNDAYTIESQKFCNILVVCTSLQHVYYIREAVQAVGAVVGEIVVVGTLTRCALLPRASDLKAAQIKLQQILIWEFTFNTAEHLKDIFWVKSDGVSWRNFARLAKSLMTKQNQIGIKPWIPMLCSKPEANPLSSTLRVSGKFGISSLITEWVVTFMISAKATGDAELRFILAKY